jgi:hypothetical protein
MSRETRKLLDEYDVSTADPFDLAVVLVGYVCHTADSESTRMNVVQGTLERWKAALEKRVAPMNVAQDKRIALALKEAADSLLQVVEELDGKT